MMRTATPAMWCFAVPTGFALKVAALLGLAGGPLARADGDGLVLSRVSGPVYALVGPTGNRDPDNLGNNASFGFVVTPAGVVLNDPAGGLAGAARIARRIAEVTDRAVELVINTGGQDHRWLGNGYFRERGAEILASSAAVQDQRQRTRDQLFVLDNLVGAEGMAGTEPVYADRTFDVSLAFEFGGVRFELLHVGPAHTPGDSLVWLPDNRVVFTGDVVYVQRMAGILDVSSSRNWLRAFAAIETLQPLHLVPGHGPATDLARARADTYDYITYLRRTVAEFMQDGGGIEAIGGLDQSAFEYLENYATLKGRNAQQVYQELEWE